MIEKDYDNGKRLWWWKKIMIMEKDCDDGKRLWLSKEIVIMEKDCDNGKRLWWLKKIMVIEILVMWIGLLRQFSTFFTKIL